MKKSKKKAAGKLVMPFINKEMSKKKMDEFLDNIGSKSTRRIKTFNTENVKVVDNQNYKTFSKYFVSFNFVIEPKDQDDTRKTGMASIVIDWSNDISDLPDLLGIINEIKKDGIYSDVNIINFIKLGNVNYSVDKIKKLIK